MPERVKQSVNFYQDSFRKPVIVLPAEQMLQAIGLVFVALLIIALLLQWSLLSQTNSINITQTQKTHLQQRLQQLQENYVEPTQDVGLLNQVKSLDTRITQQQELQRFLNDESEKITFSFADVMKDLAQNDSSKIWLSRIEIKSTGNNYKLHGMTQHADAIPEYIGQLKQADSLKGSAFSLFSLERDEQRANILHFTLSSEEEE